MPPRKIIIGTCASDKCTNNGGLITIDQRYDLIPVKGGHNMFHPECNPSLSDEVASSKPQTPSSGDPDPVETTEAA